MSSTFTGGSSRRRRRFPTMCFSFRFSRNWWRGRSSGRRISCPNFRARGWPDLAEAREAYAGALRRADLIFASVEDLKGLAGADGVAILDRYSASEIVLKLDVPACEVRVGGTPVRVDAAPVARVVDTTAAGDSFAAAYLAARIAGQEPVAAAQVAHRLAGAVVQHRGAIIPREAMPDTLLR